MTNHLNALWHEAQKGLTVEEVIKLRDDHYHPLLNELEHLKSCKESAISVLSKWDKVWEEAGRPGPLGTSKAENVLAFIKSSHLKSTSGDREVTTGGPIKILMSPTGSPVHVCKEEESIESALEGYFRSLGLWDTALLPELGPTTGKEWVEGKCWKSSSSGPTYSFINVSTQEEVEV